MPGPPVSYWDRDCEFSGGAYQIRPPANPRPTGSIVPPRGRGRHHAHTHAYTQQAQAPPHHITRSMSRGGGSSAGSRGGGGGGNRRHHQQHNVTPAVRSRPLGHPRNHISPGVKCLLFSFNFLFWLAGMSISGLGFWILIEKDKTVRDVLDVFFDPTILMCIAGVIIFSLGFFGCLGALRENICLLKLFHIVLTIILLLELLSAITVFIFYYIPSVRKSLGFMEPEEVLKQAIVKYRDDHDLRDMIDSIQRGFKCCGVANSDYGYRDWQDNMYFNCSTENPSVERCGVPHSCCRIKKGDFINVMCGFHTTNKDKLEAQKKIYLQGCLKGFGSWLERNTLIVGGVCLGIMVPQILGICLARSLIEQIFMQKAQWT